MEKEEWKVIEGFEDYQVSNLGRVKSLKFGKERILKPGAKGSKYLTVVLSEKKVLKTRTIHQLVAMAFLNHKPDGHKLVIDHKDDNPLNNNLNNLQLTTTRFNAYKTQVKYASNFKGVSWHKQIKKWVSGIYLNGKQIHLGVFNTELEASEAYQLKLKTL